MPRPCFIVVDHEHFGSISSRKLVIETAKFNVITAYSGVEALETIARFPAVNGVVVNANVRDIPPRELIASIKQAMPSMPVILIGYPASGDCDNADYSVDSFEPAKLLQLLRAICAEESTLVDRNEDRLQDTD